MMLVYLSLCFVAFGFVDYEDRRDAEVTIYQFCKNTADESYH